MYQSALTVDEQSERLYLQQCGENGAATIVDIWLDAWPFLDGVAKAHVRAALIGVLIREMSDVEVAQGASLAVGGPDYETWLKR